MGLLYFLSHDPSVPAGIRKETQQMGLCRDEFTGNGYWPHQLYIRSARRMIGEYFMTQHDLEFDTVKYDAIGMGSYNIDVRHVQRTCIPVSRFPELHYEVYNEGYISIPVAPYEIPYRALLPAYEQCKNLIVPVCISASHVAYASVRMEPQYMIMGQAAGVAAAMAVKEGRPVHRIDISLLQEKLAGQGQVLSLQENIYGAFGYGDEVIIDNNMKRFTTGKTGTWRGIETEHNGRYQMNYSRNDHPPATFTFKPWLEKDGLYEVSIWYPSDASYAASVPVLISHRKGVEQKVLNQQEEGGAWISLGTYELEKGFREVVTVVSDNTGGAVVADAIKIENAAAQEIDNYVFFNLDRHRIREKSFLETGKFVGAQLKYTWRELEPGKNNYDFQAIENDLKYLTDHGKKLFIQIQDVTFDTVRVNVPDYIIEQPGYAGGVAIQYLTDDNDQIIKQDGYVARRWDPRVAGRFYELFIELGNQFDGKIEGVNLPETAVGFGETGKLYPEGFTPEIYRNAILKQMEAARQAFTRSVVIQYANFMPGEWLPWDDRGFLKSLFLYARKNHIGMGGPDIKIYKKAQMNHSYKFLKEFSKDIPTGVAVQWGNYEEINPKTGKEVTVDEIYRFAKDEMGLDYIFWCTQEPYYTNDLIPYLKEKK